MNYTDTLINTYDDAAFQSAFRQYFGELGCRVTNWDGLFREMSAAGTDYAWQRRDESGEVVGFIQFTTLEMKSWFFTAQCGFIREFWVKPGLRGQGQGSALLQRAESWLRDQGCAYAILTTDTAPDFYLKRGYTLQKGVRAKNKDDVYIKPLA